MENLLDTAMISRRFYHRKLSSNEQTDFYPNDKAAFAALSECCKSG